MHHASVVPRLIRVLSVILLHFFAQPVCRAQSVANYAVTRVTGITYNSIYNSGTPCSNWRYNGSFQQDDNRSYPVDIGFDFWYDGARYTEVCISTNGYIDFSASTANGGPTGGAYGYNNNAFSQSNGTLLSIAPMYDDMTTQGAVNPLGNSIRSQTNGTAPNRVFTVEWYNMAVYQNTTPSLNFQVKLYETTGVIEFVYGTMTQGTALFSYTSGINASTMNGSPTTAQLKCQQTANTTIFSNGQVNNLSSVPASNSKITLTPPVPANPGSSLSFTGVAQTQMTLNWTNWATNEVGYVLYYSTDAVNWDFVTQTGANATSAVITGLYSSTTYYWRLYAVTEGALSTVVNGTQATLPGTTFISVTSGNWGTGSTWNTGTVPTSNDDVVITSTHVVTLNVTNAACHNLTVGQGQAATLRLGSNGIVRTLTVGGNIIVGSTASLIVNTASNSTHAIISYGNITNNGIFDMATDANSLCDVSFVHAVANQTVSGSGATTRFNFITVNKGTSTSRILEITSANFSAASGFLNLQNGTFKLSSTGVVNITPWIATTTIPSKARFWLNSATATVNTTGGDLNVFGDLQLSAGTMNIGNAANNSVMMNGGRFIMSGGAVKIAGRYDRSSNVIISRFSISGGTLTLNTVGSTSTTNAPFMMDVLGSQFTETGGTIIIERKGGTTQNLGFNCTGGNIYSVTSGFLQVGDAATPLAQVMQVNTIAPIGGLRVASANATAQLAVNPLVIIYDVQIQSGIFLANNLGVTLGGNWSNTGGTYTAGTNTTTFNGTTAQLISKNAPPENFNNMIFSGAGVKTAGSDFNAKDLSINLGSTLSAGSTGYTIGVSGNWTNNGTFNAGSSTGLVNFNGTVAQTISGTATTTFRDMTLQNAAGATMGHNENIKGTLLLNSGVLTTTGQVFTFISDSLGTARIGTITGGDIVGDINMQRFIYLGPTQWRQMCSPVSGMTLADWNDDIITSGFPGSDFPSFTFVSIESYNETALGPKQIGYVYPTSITNPITPKVGYFAYVGPLTVTTDVKGPPLKMNQAFTLTYTPSAGPTEDGWNMLGNPYPSAIDWDAAGWTRTNTDNVVYVWNPSIRQYASYVGGVGTNGGTKDIPSCQSFWVRSIAAAPSITVTESVKTAANPNYMHSTSTNDSIAQLLSLSLYSATRTDQCIVRFNANASDTFDIGYDALKLGSFDTTMPYIGTVMDPVNDYSIDTRGILSADITIPLHVKVGLSGNYTIRRDTSSHLPPSACITLEDRYTGVVTSLTQGATYSFSILDTTNTPRFLLHFGPALTMGQIPAECSYSFDGKAFAKGTGNGPWDYVWKDSTGNMIAQHNAVNGTDTLSGIHSGKYVVNVSGNNGYCSAREDTIFVNGPVPVYVFGSVNGPSCTYSSDGSVFIQSIGGGTAPYTLSWPDGSTADSLVSLIEGNYQLLITDAVGCIDTSNYLLQSSSLVNALFTATPDTITVQHMVAFSNYSSGAQNFYWDFGDTLGTDTDPNPFYTYNTPGVYTVSLVADDGICQDTAVENIVVLDNAAGVNPVQLEDDIRIATSDNWIDLFFDLADEQSVYIVLYDASGRMIDETHVTVMNGCVRLPVALAAGNYFIRIDRRNVSSTKKVSIIR